MSRRPGFVVDHRLPVDGGESPNAYVGRISVQVRCNWPPSAHPEEVYEAIHAAYVKAKDELARDRERWRRDEPGYRYHWTERR